MATKAATKKSANKFNLEKGFKAVKETAGNINEFALETSGEVIDATISTAGEWQGVTEKAIKGGLKLAHKQQDIVFDTLEAVKGQLLETGKKFKHLFSKN